MSRPPLNGTRQAKATITADPADLAAFKARAKGDGVTQATFFRQLIQRDTAWRLASGLALPETQTEKP